MKKIIVGAVAVLASMISLNAAAAPDMKIGIVDLQQVVQKSPEFTQINDQLTKQFKPRQDKIRDAEKNLQTEVDRLNRDSAVLSVADRNKLQDQIITDRANAQGMALSFQRDLQTAQGQATQTLMTQVYSVINSVAKQGNFDVVFLRAATAYTKDSVDITNQVIGAMKK